MRPSTQQDDRPQPRRFFSHTSQLTMAGTYQPQSRPPTQRGASATWNRLKPVQQDALQAYGLISKGDTRLKDLKSQESFYNRIVERYLKFCAASKQGDDLQKHFAALSLDSSQATGLQTSKWAPAAHSPAEPDTAIGERAGQVAGDLNKSSMDSSTPAATAGELQNIVTAMRKLREGITASKRTDTFAQRAYVFMIRATILVQNWQAYQPAVLYLLQKIHPKTPLPAPELEEFATYFALDLACRQHNLIAANVVRFDYSLKDRKLRAVLKSLREDHWVSFWQVKRKVDGYQRALLAFAEDETRLHALKCIGKSYFTAQKAWIEKATDKQWGELVESGVGWEDAGNKIIIRRPKVK